MPETVVENENNKTGKKKSNDFAYFVGAVGGVTCGLILLLTGLFLSAISFFNRIYFHGWEVISLVAAFVSLAIGSHFLDKIDAAKRAEKIELYKTRKSSERENE